MWVVATTRLESIASIVRKAISDPKTLVSSIQDRVGLVGAPGCPGPPALATIMLMTSRSEESQATASANRGSPVQDATSVSLDSTCIQTVSLVLVIMREQPTELVAVFANARLMSRDEGATAVKEASLPYTNLMDRAVSDVFVTTSLISARLPISELRSFITPRVGKFQTC